MGPSTQAAKQPLALARGQWRALHLAAMRHYLIESATRADFDRILEVALDSLGKPYPLLHLQYEPEIPVSGP